MLKKIFNIQKINYKISFIFEKKLWQKGLNFIAGLDESGYGTWAGPVVAAAVIFKPNFKKNFLTILNDSKKITKNNRNILYNKIIQNCNVAVGISSVTEIDKINILQASMIAMLRAVNNLKYKPQYTLIDGNKIPKQLLIPAKAIIKGDERSYSIAAASIIAKVTRDKIMYQLHKKYPYFEWNNNKGYGTKKHQLNLIKFGVNEYHRKSFQPIKNRNKFNINEIILKYKKLLK